MNKYLLYLGRWQLSTPILAGVTYLLVGTLGSIWTAIIANLIGAMIFFWIDRLIFKRITKKPLWEINDSVMCHCCGRLGTGYRIVEWKKYDRRDDEDPQFRCDECRKNKAREIESKLNKAAVV